MENYDFCMELYRLLWVYMDFMVGMNISCYKPRV